MDKGFQEGNKLWQLRSKDGRGRKFTSPQELWDLACEYFKFCDDNPLEQEKVFGTGLTMRPKKWRPYTIKGLCVYIDTGESTWNDYKTKEEHKDFRKIIEIIENIIYTQKFEGAAAGFFNANIIARELGLAEKIDTKPSSDGELDYSKLTDEEIKTLIKLEQKASGK